MHSDLVIRVLTVHAVEIIESLEKLKALQIKEKIEQVPKKQRKKSENFTDQIEQLYLEHYPIKIGKAKGVASLARNIKSEEDLQKLQTAIINYKNSIKDPRFTKHFSTFANCWTDWIDASNIGTEKDLDVSHVWGGDDKE
jgi:hypothetical protein